MVPCDRRSTFVRLSFHRRSTVVRPSGDLRVTFGRPSGTTGQDIHKKWTQRKCTK
ncbi:MAG: hypothetical protein IJQ95_08140 [Paludibacteraceae bacterium]|nr:hypothetical protein [Paludibacteraceae bacterium]